MLGTILVLSKPSVLRADLVSRYSYCTDVETWFSDIELKIRK